MFVHEAANDYSIAFIGQAIHFGWAFIGKIHGNPYLSAVSCKPIHYPIHPTEIIQHDETIRSTLKRAKSKNLVNAKMK